MRWLVLLFGLEFPVALAALDCTNRPASHFAEGEPDKRAWRRWLLVALVLPGVGYGIVLGYFYAVVKRNNPTT